MKPLFNIFTILKQFIINMIIRIAQNIEGLTLESYFVNYKFKTFDNVHHFELPLILEVRNEMELNILHARILASIIATTQFTPIEIEDPIEINKHKKKTLLDIYQVSNERNVDGFLEFIKNENDINSDSDAPTKKIILRTITTKTPKKLFGQIYAVSDIKDLFKFQIPTNDLK